MEIDEKFNKEIMDKFLITFVKKEDCYEHMRKLNKLHGVEFFYEVKQNPIGNGFSVYLTQNSYDVLLRSCMNHQVSEKKEKEEEEEEEEEIKLKTLKIVYIDEYEDLEEYELDFEDKGILRFENDGEKLTIYLAKGDE